MVRYLVIAVVTAVLAVVALSVYTTIDSTPTAASKAMLLPVDPTPLVAETAAGKHSFTIEVADDMHERSRGLMYRETMADDHGMLFVFDQTQPVGFWMKDTPLPLDLVFIGADGRIRDILPGTPYSEATISPGEPVRFVLELKQGTAQRLGIAAGDFIRHPEITRAGNP
jgi:uncharacterized membrane protein (UPF0127 family)